MKRKRSEHVYEILEALPFPVESFGPCRQVQRCGNWEAVLGDGLCVKCWDSRCSAQKGRGAESAVEATG